MAKENDSLSVAGIATKRLNELIEPLQEQGLTQAQIAAEAGIPPQYFSDVKRNKRPVTELIARRLGERFNFNYEWLMGTSDSMEIGSQGSATSNSSSAIMLPAFLFPIEGEPRLNKQWNGAYVEIAGVAAGRIGLLELPYILQFGHNDVQGRLKQGDLVMISQVANVDAEIHVVRYRKKLFLARANQDGSWIRVANGNQLPSDCPSTGHCIGVVWSALV